MVNQPIILPNIFPNLEILIFKKSKLLEWPEPTYR